MKVVKNLPEVMKTLNSYFITDFPIFFVLICCKPLCLNFGKNLQMLKNCWFCSSCWKRIGFRCGNLLYLDDETFSLFFTTTLRWKNITRLPEHTLTFPLTEIFFFRCASCNWVKDCWLLLGCPKILSTSLLIAELCFVWVLSKIELKLRARKM